MHTRAHTRARTLHLGNLFGEIAALYIQLGFAGKLNQYILIYKY